MSRITRRSFLKGLGLVVAGAPLVHAMPADPAAAATPVPQAAHPILDCTEGGMAAYKFVAQPSERSMKVLPQSGTIVTRYGAETVYAGQVICMDLATGHVRPAGAGDAPIGIAMGNSDNGAVDVMIMGQARIG